MLCAREKPSRSEVWLVVGSKYLVMVYTDHEALKSLFKTGNTKRGGIAT